MQIIVNCLLTDNNKALLLQKPRRNWWVAPGGKTETGENIKEAVIREYKEETGVIILNPELRSVATSIVMEDNKIVKELLIFTFHATKYEGENWERCKEGILEWVDLDKVLNLEMDEGDHKTLYFILNEKGIVYSSYVYDENYKLTISDVN
ncbi:MAG: mutT [Bacillales bacterium]|jgi:8-oxo-dGTP diphosphatase|nr:mutT [Bacillales bacterium]